MLLPNAVDSHLSFVCAIRLSGTVVFSFPICRGSPRREGMRGNQIHQRRFRAVSYCLRRSWEEDLTAAVQSHSHRGATACMFTCGGSKISRAGRGFESLVKAHGLFWPQPFNRSCKLRMSIVIEERKENRWKVKRTLVEIERIENSQCNSIKGFCTAYEWKWSETRMKSHFSKQELWHLLPVSEGAPKSDSFTSTRIVSRRSQCLFYSRESSSLPDTPAAATHLQHTGALPQESRRQSQAHNRTGVKADASPYDWSSCATCRWAEKNHSKIKLRENRNVLCAKGKKKSATCVRLSPCLSVNIVSDGRKEGLFLFHCCRQFTARFIFPKTSAIQTGTFLNNPNIKQERGFLREHTRSFVYFVPSFSFEKKKKKKTSLSAEGKK